MATLLTLPSHVGPHDLAHGNPREYRLVMANRTAPLTDPVALALENAPPGAPLSDEERAALEEARADNRPRRSKADIEAVLAQRKTE
jgi:hypothetical protein